MQSEFICVRFNQLPQLDIYNFIKTISHKENLHLNDDVIYTIQKTYKSDIRSMINFLQLNQNLIEWNNSIITNDIWESIYDFHKSRKNVELKHYIQEISIKYNTDKKSILIKYFNFIINNKLECIGESFLDNIEVIIHSQSSNLNTIMSFFCNNLSECYIKN